MAAGRWMLVALILVVACGGAQDTGRDLGGEVADAPGTPDEAIGDAASLDASGTDAQPTVDDGGSIATDLPADDAGAPAPDVPAGPDVPAEDVPAPDPGLDATAADAPVPADTSPELPPDVPTPPDPCPYGTWDAPCPIASLPAQAAADTSLSATSLAAAYAPCAPGTSEAGPEVVYSLVVPQDGILTLALDDVAGDGIDNDLHLLSGDGPDSCVARGNITLTRAVQAGESFRIAVDSWFDGKVAKAGPYILSVSLVPAPDGDCPADMQPVGAACMDRYEAPNVAGALPLVMYTFLEAEAWCGARGRRLCFDDEWTQACEGAAGTAYPYGATHQKGVCRDDATWLQYDQALLNGWPASASATTVGSLADLFAAASAVSAKAAAAADHVLALYQAAPSGDHPGCVNEFGVYDLTGNVEEWTRRRDGGEPSFHGNLKGRYWAEARTCQQGVKTHGDTFRFYEIGFRCCLDP